MAGEALPHIDCDVTLTETERARALEIALRAVPRVSGGWHGLVIAALAGLGLALAAALGDLVEPRRAGLLAAGGFLACWGGQWLQHRAIRRAWHAQAVRSWTDANRAYHLVLAPDGLTWGAPGIAYRLAWWRLHSAEAAAGFLVLRTVAGWTAVLPERCLPPEWPAATLVPRLSETIRAARRMPPGPLSG